MTPAPGPVTPATAGPSSAFERLALPVQRWVYDANWIGLRDAQETAIPLVLDAQHDVLISAATAGGKTEAAFLPIVSALHDQEPLGPGIQALYIAPLKALINDQYQRLLGMTEHTDIPVHRWHGDVGGDKKSKVLKNPDGILLLTPESLEAMFVLRGTKVPGMFGSLRYIVIDELHAFLGTERGAQLRSQLHRLETTARRPIVRIGLSATLGDMSIAAAQLRPGAPARVAIVQSEDGGQELLLQVRGYISKPAPPAARPSGDSPPPEPSPDDLTDEFDTDLDLDEDEPDDRHTTERQIAEHLFGVLRGTDNLVFANSRTNVEKYADRLRVLCEHARLPNEFFPHHGSLSKDLREDVEAALKDPSKPATAVATTTLEMGIDIGSVTSIAQIGAPPSVASLRQRLGRSGRRDTPAILRAYVTEPQIDQRTPLDDQLRGSLVQTTAMLELLLEGWCEPPDPAVLHTSTLVQQLLSLIAQHGGATAQQAHNVLCSKRGPFGHTSPSRFAELLRSLAAEQVITQDPDGTLLLGPVGERTVNHYSFYTAFQTPEEYRLLSGGRTIGTLPVDFPLYVGLLIVFGGKRWRVVNVDSQQRAVDLVRSKGGRPPAFSSGGIDVHDTVVSRMRTLLAAARVPAFLDKHAAGLLAEARAAFARERLAERSVLDRGSSTIIVPWVGTVTGHTLAMQLRVQGVDVAPDWLTLTCDKHPYSEVLDALRDIADAGPADPVTLASQVPLKETNKYDPWLAEPLLDEDYAAVRFDTTAAHATTERLLREAGVGMPRPDDNEVLCEEPVDAEAGDW